MHLGGGVRQFEDRGISLAVALQQIGLHGPLDAVDQASEHRLPVREAVEGMPYGQDMARVEQQPGAGEDLPMVVPPEAEDLRRRRHRVRTPWSTWRSP